MPENENPETQESQNNTSAADELAAVATELEEEKAASATLKEAMAGKDARIAELENSLSEAKQQSEAKATELEASVVELAKAKEASEAANTKYREALVEAHPEIPGELIVGSSIDELFGSVEKGKAVVESVRKTMESQASAAKVPAGAPTRGISTEGMTATEMITAGIQQKGGV